MSFYGEIRRQAMRGGALSRSLNPGIERIVTRLLGRCKFARRAPLVAVSPNAGLGKRRILRTKISLLDRGVVAGECIPFR